MPSPGFATARLVFFALFLALTYFVFLSFSALLSTGLWSRRISLKKSKPRPNESLFAQMEWLLQGFWVKFFLGKRKVWLGSWHCSKETTIDFFLFLAESDRNGQSPENGGLPIIKRQEALKNDWDHRCPYGPIKGADMLNLEREPDVVEIETEEGEKGDAIVRFASSQTGLEIFLRAASVHPRFVKMRWNTPLPEGTLAFGDQFERLQGNAHFGPLSADRYFAWYFALAEKEAVECGGVRVRPHSFVSFSVDQMGVNAYFDVRNGGAGVELGGRELPVACLLSSRYPHQDALAALKSFCQRMCPDGIFPKEPVYGGNDWYFAYGKSSSALILENSKMIAELAKGIANRPFMIVDDGWEEGACDGPWLPNAQFGSMRELVKAMNEGGVKAGLWIRFLANNPLLTAHPEWGLARHDELGLRHLDPSIPDVIEEIRSEIHTIKSWGFQLIKHDYSVHDMFGYFGNDLHGSVSPDEGWYFHDRSRTGAEICLDLYRAIKKECGSDCLVMGCDVFSHLAAGYAELNRVGDDTSGENWDRTRAFGVNALAFRSVQNGVFYSADADCVGYGKLSFVQNQPWLDLVSHSGTPLFISGRPASFSSEDKKVLREAFLRASKQKDTAVPLDFLTNVHPARWAINGHEVTFDWQAGQIPNLILAGEVQPLHLKKKDD